MAEAETNVIEVSGFLIRVSKETLVIVRPRMYAGHTCSARACVQGALRRRGRAAGLLISAQFKNFFPCNHFINIK